MARKRSGRSKKSTTGRRRSASGQDPSLSDSFSPRSSGWESMGDLSGGSKKKKSGKTGRISGRAKSARGRKTTGRARAVRRKSGGGHELIPVICSECFEDFSFDTSVKSDTLTCPVCEHSAARPDDGTLHRIHSLRKAEQTNYLITMVLTIVGSLAFAIWGVVQTNPANAADDAMFWGPIGVAGLAALVLMGFVVKYEGNRWEMYF